ncbi:MULTISPECIES: class I SAM-dependent rRNA methyltransferase [Allofournierella]|uniref:class I SAM-dependent rRNA methyltransferase n=1 Tax=Allofournierella TaxID=1940255 RepID=UPI002E783A26|nr:class I SAM-dependent rRNA methyltransferase [Fournierella sp.]MEE0757027.1 class I SAM-dependent rRNA methyltransferase [Fournierella sp.]
MKAERPYPAYTVTPKAEAAILKGHPWVYADEITAAPDTAPENGAVVDVLSRKGRYLGSGLLSEASKIRVRLLSRNANDRFDEDFWRRRIEYAWAYRKAIYPAEDLQCCRVVFGEADSLPGVTVDRFGPILSVQILSYGMEKRKELLARLLVETLQADGQVIEGVFLRNDVALREKEGLSEGKGWLEVPGLVHPEKAETVITENGVRYHVDVENGQKTGFFLDQKLNRRRVAQLAKGRRVLDCFTHTGSFALNAAFGGAEHVTAVDVSEAAVEMARANAVLNGLEGRMDFVCADVFDLLPGLEGKHDYDFIILDPPAFTKARKTAANAMRGYKEINYRAMKLLPRGGILATASCSHFATPAMFEKMLADAAQDAGRQLRQIEARQQAPDHPILWNVEETNYLKFYLFQVV